MTEKKKDKKTKPEHTSDELSKLPAFLHLLILFSGIKLNAIYSNKRLS